MKIKHLEAREDFDGIFITSLNNYINSKFITSVRNPLQAHEKLTFRKNRELNLVYSNKTSLAIKKSFADQFKYSPNFIRRLTKCFFEIPAYHSEMKDWIILPGNHSIRIINSKLKKSIVIKKHGFNTSFLRTDAMIRINHPYLLAPKIIEKSPDWNWYIEEKIDGLPLNRLSNKKTKIITLETAINSLQELRNQTLTKVLVFEYLKKLRNKVKILTNSIPKLDQKTLKQIEQLINFTDYTQNKSKNFTLSLCMSHGDFQPANIISGETNVWIIDWEYSLKRSVMYDSLVYETKSRSPAGFSKRLHHLYDLIKELNGLNSWGYFQEGNASVLITTFLLEDLTLRLEEISTDAICVKNAGLSMWTTEVALFLDSKFDKLNL